MTLQPAHGEPIKGRAERVQGEDDLQQAYQAMRVSPIWVPWLMSLDIKPKVEDFIAKRERVYLFTIQVGGAQPIVVFHRPFQSRLGQGVVLAGGVTVQKSLFLEHRYGLVLIVTHNFLISVTDRFPFYKL